MGRMLLQSSLKRPKRFPFRKAKQRLRPRVSRLREKDMPISASTVTGAGGNQRFVCDLISTATTDGDTSATLTIAHGFSAQLKNVTDATNRLRNTFENILNMGGLSQWYVISRDTTNVYVSKPVNQVGSANAAGQTRLHVECVHSEVE